MRRIRAAWAVFAFECRRQMSGWRLLITLALASVPAAILWLIEHQGGRLVERQEAWCLALFALVPEIVCLLGLLLWVTPVVQAEVEGKTWPYLVVRPAGKTPILAGKYAAGVLWSMLTGWAALTLALGVLWPPQPTPHASSVLTAEDSTSRVSDESVQQILHGSCILAALVALSCVSYGSLFALLGVIFLRRGMIFAVAYTLLEFIVRWIPAMIRQATVQYHLQGLLVHWMHWENPRFEAFFGKTEPWQHVATLLGYAVVLFLVAAAVLRRRELVAATEAAP